MSHCRTCANWVCIRQRLYGDGSTQVYYEAPEGKGHCEVLGLDTMPEFGCIAFVAGDEHIKVETIEGAPWEHWTMIPCPDCNGVGSANDRACRRCSGTARVRRYDDGYVADATWDHPLEKARKQGKPIVPDPGTILHNVRASKEGALL